MPERMDKMKHDLATSLKPLTDLQTHPDNPRQGNIDLIAESLQANGQYRPIVVTPDGTILAGNHTYLAARSLGWEHISAVTIDVEPGSPAATKIMLADNRTSDVGGYDDDKLLALLQSVSDDLAGSGYADFDVEDLTPPDTGVVDDFPIVDDDLPIEHQCPSCGYQWSGSSSAP